MQNVLEKIISARYNLYIETWAKGDDYIKEYNSTRSDTQAELATVSETYDYYLSAWCKQFSL